MAGGCVQGTATWSLKLTLNPLVLPRVITCRHEIHLGPVWLVSNHHFQPQNMVFQPQNYRGYCAPF